LSPTQAVIIPITDRQIEYAYQVAKQLTSLGIRVGVDTRNERMNAKVRQAQLEKIPYMLIIGDREVESKSVSVRLRSGENHGAMSINQAHEVIKSAIDSQE
jgi:threonyl-tRNA synthetase